MWPPRLAESIPALGLFSLLHRAFPSTRELLARQPLTGGGVHPVPHLHTAPFTVVTPAPLGASPPGPTGPPVGPGLRTPDTGPVPTLVWPLVVSLGPPL